MTQKLIEIIKKDTGDLLKCSKTSKGLVHVLPLLQLSENHGGTGEGHFNMFDYFLIWHSDYYISHCYHGYFTNQMYS